MDMFNDINTILKCFKIYLGCFVTGLVETPASFLGFVQYLWSIPMSLKLIGNILDVLQQLKHIASLIDSAKVTCGLNF
jgi:hypothetical protein